MTMAIITTLRAAQPDDLDFLYEVYASTRAEEMAIVPWTAEQKEAFLRMQFHAQHTYYHEQFPQTAYQIILLDGQRVGRLYIDRRPDEIRIIDIALLPAYRNQGIGTHYLKQTFDQARQANLAVRIHVEQFNPALNLYTRLGFQRVTENGIYYLMEWKPDATG
jgi:ribosomal protein S18 acetylase RimI-like enzyme